MVALCFPGSVKPLVIADSEEILFGWQEEIRRSEQSRYGHRLPGVLLVAQALRCPEVAPLRGEAPRTVESWVQGFAKTARAGRREGERSGRPRRLSGQPWRQGNAPTAPEAARSRTERP
jgi:hypothetical protein